MYETTAREAQFVSFHRTMRFVMQGTNAKATGVKTRERLNKSSWLVGRGDAPGTRDSGWLPVLPRTPFRTPVSWNFSYDRTSSNKWLLTWTLLQIFPFRKCEVLLPRYSTVVVLWIMLWIKGFNDLEAL